MGTCLVKGWLKFFVAYLGYDFGKKIKEAKPLMGVWMRTSVFFGLTYWKVLGTPHCLDVMHITKNVCKSLLGTLFNMPDRTKDGPK